MTIRRVSFLPRRPLATTGNRAGLVASFFCGIDRRRSGRNGGVMIQNELPSHN